MKTGHVEKRRKRSVRRRRHLHPLLRGNEKERETKETTVSPIVAAIVAVEAAPLLVVVSLPESETVTDEVHHPPALVPSLLAPCRTQGKGHHLQGSAAALPLVPEHLPRLLVVTDPHPLLPIIAPVTDPHLPYVVRARAHAQDHRGVLLNHCLLNSWRRRATMKADVAGHSHLAVVEAGLSRRAHPCRLALGLAEVVRGAAVVGAEISKKNVLL